MAQDNLEPLITQCPNCDTRFRVTEAQLQIAHGRVRCGACLGVFDGAEHLSLDGEDVEQGGETDVDALLEELDEIGDQANPVPELVDKDLIPRNESQMLGGDDPHELPEELLALEAQFMDEMRRPGRDAITVDAGVTDEALAKDKPVKKESAEQDAEERSGEAAEATDTATAIEEKATEAQLTEARGTEARGTEAEVADAELEDAEVEEAELEEAEDNVAQGEADADWIEDLEVEDWADVERVDDAEPSADDAKKTTPSQTDEVAADQEIELQALPGSEDLVQSEEVSAPANRVQQADAAGVTSAHVTADLETGDLYDEAPRARRSWLTYLLLLLGLIALPAQVLWFQYDAWVKNPEYRPIYEWMCEVANCELPPLKDISLITAKRSFIRAHPERDDARIVDVLMVNNADFAQPFPLIELIATSMRGQLVAGRRFKPSEYLQGDMANAELFPPRTPIHVSLEIQDPGADALNFEVKFR